MTCLSAWHGVGGNQDSTDLVGMLCGTLSARCTRDSMFNTPKWERPTVSVSETHINEPVMPRDLSNGLLQKDRRTVHCSGGLCTELAPPSA